MRGYLIPLRLSAPRPPLSLSLCLLHPLPLPLSLPFTLTLASSASSFSPFNTIARLRVRSIAMMLLLLRRRTRLKKWPFFIQPLMSGCCNIRSDPCSYPLLPSLSPSLLLSPLSSASSSSRRRTQEPQSIPRPGLCLSPVSLLLPSFSSRLFSSPQTHG